MEEVQLGLGLRSFNLHSSQSLSVGRSLSRHMTLRNACIDYRDAGGISWVKSQMPESSGATSTDQMPCLNMFRNNIGQVHEASIICYPMRKCASVLEVLEYAARSLSESIVDGRLWAISGTIKYNVLHDGRWGSIHVAISRDEHEVLDLLLSVCATPVSASIVHAAMESSHYTDNVGYSELFKFPHNASPSAGLIGTLHDNQCIDMNAGEDSKVPNVIKREYLEDYLGFICAGHTSHSSEAGRIRRVTCDTRVRVLSSDTVDAIDDLQNFLVEYNSAVRTWTIFCMGYYSSASESEVLSIAARHKLKSYSGPTTYSMHVYETSKLVVLSVSSGTILKLTSTGCWADSVEVHHSSHLRTGIRPKIFKIGNDQLRACFSTFFNLIPYISSDRAPRPLFSSVQTPQAVCLPWCPGTAAVSPCYTFNPVVTTPLYADIMNDLNTDTSNVASYLPGENVIVLYLNLPGNYEDAILVSRKYLDNGGFSTTSMCTYLLSGSEFVPPLNAIMCAELCRWWKSPCQQGCKHTVSYITAKSVYCVGYCPTGILVSSIKHPSGDITVRIRSHQQLQQGDKLSTGHGQKGVGVITDYCDMPIAHHPTQGTVIPDVVVAMSSIVTRQTNGQLYEAAKAMSVMQSGTSAPAVVRACETTDLGEDVEVFSGITGERYATATYDSNGKLKMKPTRATLGMVRMFNQTQMTRERHHVSHLGPGKRAVRTQTGRTRGGGVAWGEMEVQALSSAGLHSCDEEIASRGDRGTGRVCTQCQRLGLLCVCTSEESHVLATLPEDLRTLDITTYISHNGSFRYTLEPELS